MGLRIGITGGVGTTAGPDAPEDKTTLDFWLAVRQAGAEPWVLPSLDPAEAVGQLAHLDGVLFAGGADLDPAHYGEAAHPELGPLEPARDAFELALFRAAWARPDLPILGVCRGMQLMNVALGGTLYQDLPSQRPTETSHRQRERKTEHTHGVTIAPGSRLHAAMGAPAGVNTLHHQAVKDLAPGLVAVAWSPDGLIEGVEWPGAAFRLGVQWHPEILALWEEASQALFLALVGAARAAKGQPGSGLEL